MARFWRRFLCCRAKSTVTVITRRITDDGFTVGAGPDPYSDYTESCDKHIGYLLGWQPEAKDTDEIFWEVWPR
jgi:hypothetical protein